MSSFVFYRFKSQKEPSRISFDGLSIGVWDLKKEIIHNNKMGKGGDFDFAIYNADTDEEYHDRESVPRSTSVIARRLPPSKPGKGNALQYMAPSNDDGPITVARPGQFGAPPGGWSGASMSKRFDAPGAGGAAQAEQTPAEIVAPAAASGDEASALAAMFAATSEQWNQTQQQMAAATPIHRGPQRPMTNRPPPSSGAGPPGGSGGQPGGYRPHPPPGSAEHKPPPSGYICYRCGQKGHWIQDCPTNSDRAFDDRPRIKRTTGIPKSFLQTVEGPGNEASPAGVMVTAEGGFVIARPDNASWLAHRAITKNLSADQVQNLAPTDPDLTCPICSKLLRDATLTPCCSTSFCEDCIHNALVDGDMMCPECESRVKNIEKLKPDEPRRERVKKYIEDVVEASKQVEETTEDGVKTEEGEEGAEVKKEEKDEVVKKEEGTPAPAAEVSATPAASVATATVEPTPAAATPAPQAQPNNQQQQQQQQMNAAQQQQFFQQQQLRQQQAMQQQMAQNLPNVQVLQTQIYQLTMTLQNPQLPPPMRMQLMQNLQQCQMMLQMQVMNQQQQHQQQQMMQQQQQQAQFQQQQQRSIPQGSIPTGPRAAVVVPGAPTGPKRAREASPEAQNKRAASPTASVGGK